MIYFLKDSANAAIKVGYSSKAEPSLRIASLQTGNPRKLVLIGYIEGDQEMEIKLHERFSEYRTDGGREWYEADPDLVEEINGLLGDGGNFELKAFSDLIWILKNGGEQAFSVRHPMHQTIGRQIAEIAKDLSRVGGIESMFRVYEAVEAYVCQNHSPKQSVDIMYCLDHRFSGIGGWCA